MYKLLLVDDETATREGILEGIRWKKLGISEVITEKNGALALETAKHFIPDILLTDIKMPKMNGIELSHHIREINPNCTILIMSGYSEIDYLKSAIRLNAINFVDKPVELADLEQWIIKSVEAQNAIQKHQALLRDEISSKFSYQGFTDQQLLSLIQQLYPQVTEASICTAFLLKAFPSKFETGSISADLPQIMQTCTGIIESRKIKYAARISDPDTIAFYLLDWNNKNAAANAQELYDLFQTACFGVELFLAVGKPYALADCYLSSKSALDALSKIFFSQEKRLLFAADTLQSASPGNVLTSVNYKEFSQALRQGNFDGAVNFIKKLSLLLNKQTNIPIKSITEIYFQLLFELLKQNSVITSSISNDFVWDWLSKCPFLCDMEEYTISCVRKYFEAIYSKNAQSPIDQILLIIQTQYSNQNLSLNEISRQVFLSPAYICVKFKEFTGKTLTQYMTEYRIEAAIPLLMEKNSKINDIAEQVGFDNGNYFAKIFKKIKGIAPVTYREQFCK